MLTSKPQLLVNQVTKPFFSPHHCRPHHPAVSPSGTSCMGHKWARSVYGKSTWALSIMAPPYLCGP